jgi:hypothetical protein
MSGIAKPEDTPDCVNLLHRVGQSNHARKCLPNFGADLVKVLIRVDSGHLLHQLEVLDYSGRHISERMNSPQHILWCVVEAISMAQPLN